MQFLSKSSKQTQKLAENLAKESVKKYFQKKGSLIVGLEGELGAGKTTFVKGFAKGLGIKEILNDPKNLVLIEWSDRVKKILPKNYLKIHIDHVNKKERKIVIDNDKWQNSNDKSMTKSKILN